jgi:hypothetical protein
MPSGRAGQREDFQNPYAFEVLLSNSNITLVCTN